MVQMIEELQVGLIENNRDWQERDKRQRKGEVRGGERRDLGAEGEAIQLMMIMKTQEGMDHMKERDQLQANNQIHHSDRQVNMYKYHIQIQVDVRTIGNDNREGIEMKIPVVVRIIDQESDSMDIMEPVVLEVGTRMEMMMVIREEVEEDVGDMIMDHMVISGEDTGTKTH